MKEVGQLVFATNQPEINSYNSQNPCITQLSYNLDGKSTAEIQILVGIYQVSEGDIENPAKLNKTINANAQNPQKAPNPLPITTFDYQEAITSKLNLLHCKSRF